MSAAAVIAPRPRAPVGGVVQRFANVSSPNDRAEVEAHDTARVVMRMSRPATPAPVSRMSGAAIQRAAATNAPALNPKPSAARAPWPMGGAGNLPAHTRKFMEPRFGADFGAVRVHTDDSAANKARQIDAAAFTAGKDIYFGKGKYQPDTAAGKELIAHELTHTIQQGAAPQCPAGCAPVAVREKPAATRQRAGGILDWFADKANYIPGFRMFCIVLGVNPVNMAAVDRSAGNVLRAVIEFMPGGKLIGDALEGHGIFEKVGGWVDEKLRTLNMVGSSFKQAIDKFVDGISASDILWVPGWGDLWQQAQRIFTEPVARLKSFVSSLATEIIQFIREAILLPLAALAEGTRGYDLLKAVLGEDPVTGEPVPRNAETLIGGFMKLIGEEEIWENIKKANAIPRCWAWFQSAMNELMGFVRAIPGSFVATFKALEVADLILVPRAFAKIAGVFGSFVAEFLTWAGKSAWKLLEIIFEVVAPAAIPYLKKVGDSFKQILKNPIGFVGNLVKAGKLGFEKFADNIGAHLKKALIEWLTGSLPGVYIPQKLEIREILKFMLSVLGLTWTNIRVKLVKAVGETAVKVLETGFDIVKTLVTEGPAAAWDKIKEELANLKDMVIDAITSFVVETIVKKAVMKVVSLLVPGGAFIQAIISIYDTIMVFIDKLSKIIQVAKAFLDSMMDIVAGKLEGAAKKVEGVLAGLLTLAISFLAGFLGLGKIADKVMEIIKKIRAPIDKALDFLVNWIVNAGKALYGKAKGAVKDWWTKKTSFTTKSGKRHELSYAGGEKNAVPMFASEQTMTTADHAKVFKKLAGAPNATAEQKQIASLIPATELLASKKPDDPALVENMKLLFYAFEPGGAQKTTKISRVTSSVGGDTVGVYMKAENLHANHPAGTVPGSGEQATLMDQLVTDKSKKSEFKYIKGHLLNHNIGGLGNAENMFPLTSNANSQHLVNAESQVKKWVQTEGSYVDYEVKVTSIKYSLNGIKDDTANFVDCTLLCSATHNKAKGDVEKMPTKTIRSEYTKKWNKENFDASTGKEITPKKKN
ncbi:eCIS core domain-containing protein [Paraburkholderia graminis]|uniref:eCIS core domain-containing protein n=1 Tax=Paraburkholderia graminis TaxID=60548 RepID=UPI0038BC9B4B